MSISVRERNAEFEVFRGYLMEKSSGSFLIWSYPRGSIPYDIVCILILVFIFLIPRGCFVRGKNEPSENAGRQTFEESKIPEHVEQ